MAINREKYLKIKDAAEVAGITPRELRYMAEQGLVSFGFLPGAVRPLRRFRESEMVALRKGIELSFERNSAGLGGGSERRRRG